MLLVLLLWLWVAGVSYGLGHALAGPRLAPTLPPELRLAVGLAGLSWLLALLSFGLSIGPGVQLGLTAAAVGYGFWCLLKAPAVVRQTWWVELRASWQEPGWLGAVALALVFGALLLLHAAQMPILSDTGLYHAQTVQWLQTYPVVPGLGNLHGRLAFNSHLHLLTGFFSARANGPWASLGQQAASSFWFVLLISYAARQLARPRPAAVLAVYGGLSLVFVFIAFRPWISSPMPDSGVTILTLLVLGWLLEKLLAPGGSVQLSRAEAGLLVALLATAVTYKASAGYLALPLGFALWRLRPTNLSMPRLVGLACLIGALVALPWLGRNVVLSGYPVYPLAPWAALPLDWTVPATQAVADLLEIRYFARWPAGDWVTGGHQPALAWVPFWWRQQAPHDQVLALIIVALALLLALRQLLSPARQQRSATVLFGLLLACCGLWFAAAPAFRFGYGYLIGAAAVGAALLAGGLPGDPWLRRAVLALALVYGLNGLRHEIGAFSPATWFRPAPYAALPIASTRLEGRPVRLGIRGSGFRCNNCPLPCAAGRLPPDLHWRGPRISQGFRRGLE
ncbi:LIC_10190 family membrane protein [Hymenobacter psychrophilus]|uniref:DUF8201 domain-containing protein n=1 Tax=Hymenobacter psychrophilus TaxID=651662 RepID=A0A1H3HXI2_9BACT|nr:hypothetical protein [Hymenobacter psychrophilus]SDY20176.1 hypothetical protein SAMN04488069_106194 [Hymenobacter psychrophilus]